MTKYKMYFSTIIKITPIIVLSLGLLMLLFAIFMGWSAELRFSARRSELSKLRIAGDSGDIAWINNYLMRAKATNGKMIAMSHIKKYQDPSSVPVLIHHLSYELSWWDELDRNDRASDIRISAYIVLKSYGDSIVDILEDKLTSSNDIAVIYLKSLLYSAGNTHLAEGLCEHFLHVFNYEDDIDYLKRNLNLNCPHYD